MKSIHFVLNLSARYRCTRTCAWVHQGFTLAREGSNEGGTLPKKQEKAHTSEANEISTAHSTRTEQQVAPLSDKHNRTLLLFNKQQLHRTVI